MRLLPTLLISATVALLLTVPAVPAVAAPPAAFELDTSSPCYAGGCRAQLYYGGAAGLDHQVTIEVDWDHAGAPEAGFAPDARQVCGPLLQTAPPVPGLPPLPPSIVARVPCELASPTFATATATTVALRVTDADGTTSYAAQPLQVLARPSRATTPTRTPASRDRNGGYELCNNTPPGVKCQPGGGRRTAGGGEKVSHKGWPAIDGVFWQVIDDGGRAKAGGPANDELLGHHGSDRLDGGPGNDVLWGDWDPKNNNTRQRDVLNGGAGNDFIYPSHGTTTVKAGPGRDYIWAFYGKGVIDCGPGHDTVRVRLNGAFRLRNCEVVGHFCQFGSDGHGGCKKPGEVATRRRDLAAALPW